MLRTARPGGRTAVGSRISAVDSFKLLVLVIPSAPNDATAAAANTPSEPCPPTTSIWNRAATAESKQADRFHCARESSLRSPTVAGTRATLLTGWELRRLKSETEF